MVAGGGAINIVGDPMCVRVLTGQEAGTGRGTQRRRHERIAEKRPFSSDPVNIGRLGKRVTGTAQFVPAKIIYQNDYYVGSSIICRAGRALAGHFYRKSQQ